MGKAWTECSKDELAHCYSCILWSLREKTHSLMRKHNDTYYVVPQFMTEKRFDEQIKQGKIDAKEAIELIWKKRYGGTPDIVPLVIINYDEFLLLEWGWDYFKDLKIAEEHIKKMLGK